MSATVGRNVGLNAYVVCVRGGEAQRIGDRIEGLRSSGIAYYGR